MTFQPGQSGNPGGRPKGLASLMQKAREHTDRAVEVLAEGLHDPDPRVRVASAKELLDRGWGKALTMSADVTKKLDQYDDAQLDAAIAALESVLGSGGAGAAPNGAGGKAAH